MQKNLWQSQEWQSFQNNLERQTYLLNTKKASLLAVKYHLLLKYNWIDIPRGPVGKFQDYSKLLQALIQEAKKNQTVFIRLMPFEVDQITTLKYPIKKAHANHHPETTLKIDLKQSEEKILKQMKPKGRYNIRLAEKKGVIIKASEDTSVFFKLIQETTQRNQFWGHSQKYYSIMLKSLPKNAQLLFAEYEGKVIAGGIFIYYQDEAIYYYGASGNKHRNVMAPYLLQWKAILEAKKRGCLSYDFLGIAPDNAPKNHPWSGVTEFKKKFGGEIINYSPAYEIILNPFLYNLFIFFKKIKKIIH